MERLTIRNSDGSVSQPLNLRWADALERLAAYEDTGLEPEEISELKERFDIEKAALGLWKQQYYDLLSNKLDVNVEWFKEILQAEHEKRLVVLPCKEGDMVYAISQPCGGCECYNEVMCEEFTDRCANCEKTEIIEIPFDLSCYIEFGKAVFLTREEAEAALKGGGDNGAD